MQVGWWIGRLLVEGGMLFGKQGKQAGRRVS